MNWRRGRRDAVVDRMGEPSRHADYGRYNVMLFNMLKCCGQFHIMQAPDNITPLHGAESSMTARSRSRVNRLIPPQAAATGRGRLRRRIFARETSRLALILFLAATFFLLCPLWAYLSLCSMDAHHDTGQSCFLYSFIFNMPVSLVTPALLLIILASLGLVTVYWQPFVFHTLFCRFLARAPPLS
jgi:hypothetical protein